MQPTAAISESADMSLDDRVLTAFANAAEQTGQRKAAIDAAANDPTTVSNPEKLLELQKAMSSYVVDVSMESTLAHKATSAIDTLMRS
ncbi:hypothetical protein VL15_37915 [Burkholderia cepacia]|uniref:Type III secretion system protein n=1 Tax=Burkholderia cepacia TaxID=292 RepID=A0A0J5W1W1_BURCE|nr:hypothetical protein VL15_37915 [Burkholderia cepacia]